MGARLPSGLVTLAFTDVVDSTRLLAENGALFSRALRIVQGRIGAAAEQHDGVVVRTQGDGAFLAFSAAHNAVACLAEIQRSNLPVQGLPHLPLRAGAHTGDAVAVDGDYISLTVHVASRVAAAAGAGQVLVSQAVIDNLTDAAAVSLGPFELKGLDDPVVLWRTAGDDTPPRAVPARRTNVADSRTSFVSRLDEMARLTVALDRPGLITVIGPGGVGKTRLVSEIALSQARVRTGGAWLVELATVEDATDVGGAITSALGMTGAVSVDAIAAEANRRGEVVLIFDNCEQVRAEAAAISERLLRACPELRLLATSREPLDVAGESLFRLAPLPVGAGQAGAVGPAEELFRSRAAAAGATGKSMSSEVVEEICRRLDGLPLALELAAVRAGEMPLPELAKSLSDGHLELHRDTGEARQRSLDALVSWSVDRLASADRDALLTLSLLPAGFDADVATALLANIPGAGAHTVHGLVRRSLVDLDGDRYRMLAVIRAVARGWLDSRTELKRAAFEALADWALNHPAVLTLDAQAVGRDTYLALEEAFAYMFSQGRAGAGRLLSLLVGWTKEFSPSSRLSKYCDEIRGVDIAHADADTAVMAAAALRCSMGAYGRTADMDRWQPHWVLDLVATARRTASGDDLALCLQQAGIYFAHMGDLSRAQRLFAEAGSVAGIGWYMRSAAAGNLAVTLQSTGRYAEAEHLYLRELEEIEHRGHQRDTIRLALNLAELRLDTGDPEGALEILRPRLNVGAGRVSTAPVLALFVEALVRTRGADGLDELTAQALRRLEDAMQTDPSLRLYAERLTDQLPRAARD